jgi:glycosyltransferase involved in cell wall biosynthesis
LRDNVEAQFTKRAAAFWVLGPQETKNDSDWRTTQPSMKLAVITPFPPMKLAEADHGLRLCQHLAAANVDVHVLTSTDSISDSTPGMSVRRVMRDWSWKDWPRMRRFFKDVRPDGVLLFYYGPMYGGHSMITFAPTLAKRLIPNATFVTQISYPTGFGTEPATLTARVIRKLAELRAGTEWVDYSYGTIFRDSDRIVVFCDMHRNVLAQHSPAANEKSVLIPPPPFLRMAPDANGIYRKRVNEKFGIGSHEFIAAYFGYIYRSKGIETLLRAFRIAQQRIPDMRLLLIGGVPTNSPDCQTYVDEIRQLVVELGLQDRVTWTGDYPWDSDFGSRYLRAVDLCVLPFDQGVHLNNSSFSAVASHGLPILTTRSDSVEPQFVHDENVFLCPPKDPGAMAEALERLIQDAGLRDRLREGVRHMAREWFSWESVIRRTLAMYKSAAARRVHPA